MQAARTTALTPSLDKPAERSAGAQEQLPTRTARATVAEVVDDRLADIAGKR